MSDEQEVVLDHIRSGKNVIVDACAGSGKSTTILSIAKALPNKTIRQFTYNSMLRHEVKEKIRELQLSNIQVHTYHSFAVKYYMSNAHTDTGIRILIHQDIKPRQPIPPIDILVLDESQDMTFLYFQLIVKMSRDMKTPFQLLILGDYMQGIYEFKGADIRFLTKAEHFWYAAPFLTSSVFEKCSLQMSYRITNQMADFVNRDMLGEERIKACRDGPMVVYIRRPRHQIEQIVVYQIRRLLKEGESPNDIFVLGSSVKGPNSDIRHMENALTEHNIPCHVPMFESGVVDERVIDGKVVFSTFHSVKGRQRKYVFVVGFDQGYFYNARNIDKTVCPNTLYVGTTRATHGLFLLENDSSRPLEFLKNTHHVMKQSSYIDFKGIPQTIFHNTANLGIEDSENLIPTHYTTATKLTNFIQETVLEEITPLIEKIFVVETPFSPESEIDISTIVKTHYGLYEDVSDLNGIAIPNIFYDKMFSDTPSSANIIKQMIKQNIAEMKGRHHFLKKAAESIPEILETPGDHLYLANVYVAVQEKLYFKLKQIHRDEYNWLSNEILDKCVSCLQKNIEDISNNREIEKEIIHHSHETEHAKIDAVLFPHFGNEIKFRFSARVDLLTDSTLWELKCTSQISMDHKIQTVVYAWLWRILYEPSAINKKQIRILNIRTGERLRIDATTEELTQIVVSLLRGKYGKPLALSNDEFVANCKEYILADTLFWDL